MVFGLALSGWYMSNRIVAAEAPQAAPIAAQPIASAAQPEDTTPLPPELYLQIAALGSGEDMDFVTGLHSKGFRAYLEINPAHAAECVLIGPFDTPDDRATARRNLSAMGVLAVDTTR